MMDDHSLFRARLSQAKRVVVKVGTRVLVAENGKPATPRIRSLVRQLSALQQTGVDVIFVTSGAIGAGMEAMQLNDRPSELAALQTAAAVGQHRLMNQYGRYFESAGITIAQVLLTHDDLQVRERHLNARSAINFMLKRGIIPVVNENDAVSVNEIRFGDNDVLASLVAILADADALLLLTTTDGLRQFQPDGRSRRIPFVKSVTPNELGLAIGKSSSLSTGGMASKLESAGNAARQGIQCVIADGLKPRIINRVFAGEDTGTLIGAGSESHLPMRKRWFGFFRKSSGNVMIDDGAARAIMTKGNSLLPIGITAVNGDFKRGDVIDIMNLRLDVIARGISNYDSSVVRMNMGRRSSQMDTGSDVFDPEVIHRDNMIVLTLESL